MAVVPQRLLLLITDLEIGGTPTVVRELATRLTRVGIAEVEVACLGKRGPVADQIEAAGVTVTALGARGTFDFPIAMSRLNRLIGDGRFNTVLSFLVHANVMAAAVAGKFPEVRFFQSIQTTQRRPRWHWKLQSVAQESAKKIVVPSESVAAAAREWAGVQPEKIVVIPNAVDAAEFEDHRREAGADFAVGFLGRLDRVKRVGDLVEAMTCVQRPTHLHIFGEGKDRPKIAERIQTLGVGQYVTMHGAVLRPADALRQMDVLVLPSEAEGFGLVLIEAMAAGVAVVATDVAGIRDVVRDSENGLLVPVDSPMALAVAIERLRKDLPLRAKLIEAGLREVRERYAWDVVLPRYATLLA